MIWRNTEMVESQPHSPNERWGDGVSSTSRDFRLVNGSWSSRVQAAYDIIGYNVVSIANGFPYIQRIVPMPLPAFNGVIEAPDSPLIGSVPPNFAARIWAVVIKRTQPIGVSTGPSKTAVGPLASDYAGSVISVEFSILPYPILTDETLLALPGSSFNGNPDEGLALASNGWLGSRFINRHKDPFSRLVKLPYGYAFVDGQPAPQDIPLREGGNIVRYTWYKVPLEGIQPGYNQSRISAALGRINNNWFDGMEPGTVLLDNYTTREYEGAFGEWLADVTFVMIHLPHAATGWEVYPRANTISGSVLPMTEVPYFPNNAITPGTGGQPLGWNYILNTVKISTPGGVFKSPVYLPVTFGEVEGTPPLFQSADFSSLFRP